MANVFRPEPINKSDLDIWGPKQLQQTRLSYGILTCQCYDDSGTLKMTIGKIGLIDDSVFGVLEIDTITIISIAGITSGNWFKVEANRTGTTVNIIASDTDTGVDTDASILPPDFIASYDPEKGGFYIDSNKRCIAVGYVDGSGNLDGIVNALPVTEGYIGFIDDYNNFFNKSIEDRFEKININGNLTIGDGKTNKEWVFKGNYTVTLPTVADNVGVRKRFVNGGTYASSIDGEGAETFVFRDGTTAATITFTKKGDFIEIESDGTNWIVIDGLWGYTTATLTDGSGTADGGGDYVDSAFTYYFKRIGDGLVEFWGWGWIEAAGAAANMKVDITMPITYSEIQSVVSVWNGYKSSDPSSIDDAANMGVDSIFNVNAGFVGTVSTLTVNIVKSFNFTANRRHLFSVNIKGIV